MSRLQSMLDAIPERASAHAMKFALLAGMISPCLLLMSFDDRRLRPIVFAALGHHFRITAIHQMIVLLCTVIVLTTILAFAFAINVVPILSMIGTTVEKIVRVLWSGLVRLFSGL
jgi:hypothetical protein